MKLSEMSDNEKQVSKIAWRIVSEKVGELLNSMMDNEENTVEYKMCKSTLKDKEYIIESSYNEVMCEIETKRIKNLKFVGKSFIKERIEQRYKRIMIDEGCI